MCGGKAALRRFFRELGLDHLQLHAGGVRTASLRADTDMRCRKQLCGFRSSEPDNQGVDACLFPA